MNHPTTLLAAFLGLFSGRQFARRIDPARKPLQAPARIGRNDPCPCRSGLKFKRCCGKGHT